MCAEAAAEENDKADEAISETAEASAGGIQETIGQFLQARTFDRS